MKDGEGPIGEDEFLDALLGVLPLLVPGGKPSRRPPPLGIAVSGGVDSMALATLFAQCKDFQLSSLHGFIVDHKARAESTDEAHWVAGQLAKSTRLLCTIRCVHGS